MHKDLEEIKRILEVCKKNEGISTYSEYILGKICAKTNDLGRSDKTQEYFLRKEYLVETFKNLLCIIEDCCKDDKCSACVISRWCNEYRNRQQQIEQDRRGLTYADFFCGAGGLSWGFHRAGYKMSLANDIQECCIDTISFNHPEVPEKHIIASDINDVLSKIANISLNPQIFLNHL